MSSEENIALVTDRVEQAIQDKVMTVTAEKAWVTHYGANDIHPKHLVYRIVVESDEERGRLARDSELMAALRQCLATHNYPIAGRDGVMIRFDSEEMVNKEAGGNYYRYWK